MTKELICTSCGEILENEHRFCGNCGAQNGSFAEAKTDSLESDDNAQPSIARPSASRSGIEDWPPFHALLIESGLDELVPLFIAADIDQATFLSLTADDLREIGVTKLGHRKRLLAVIESRGHSSANDASVAEPKPKAEKKSKKKGKAEKYRILADNALEGGEGAEALNYYNKIIELEPTDARAWLGKCRAMGKLATLENLREKATMSAAKNAVKYTPTATKATVRVEAARALTEFCLLVLASAKAYEERVGGNDPFALTSANRAANNMGRVAMAAGLRQEIMRRVIPCIELAVEFAPSDTVVLEAAIAVTGAAPDSKFRLVHSTQKRYIAMMKEVNPGYQTRSACFPGSACVLTPQGYQPIRHLCVGDIVLSYTRSGLVRRIITRRFCHEPKESLSIGFANSEKVLRVTPNHVIATDRGHWVRAGAVKAGDRIQSAKQGLVVRTVERSPSREQLYNLYTAGEHNFIVDGVVVHNFAHFVALRTWWHRLVLDPLPPLLPLDDIALLTKRHSK
jgi:hypothetical protein